MRVKTATNFSKSLNALVYKVDEKKDLAWIAYPWSIFDRGGNIQNIFTFIAGNIFGMSSLEKCKLLDVYFPPQMLVHYDGPSYTLNDMRNYLKIFDRPILGTIVKPKIGLTSSEYAEVCYDFWSSGGDFVKNDEPQADQEFCPFEKMVDAVRNAMDRAEDETSHAKVHSFNISAPDYNTMKKRADYIISKMRPNSFAFLIDGITAGWMAVQTIRREYPDVFLHFHRAGHGAYTRSENPIGFSVPVLSKFARLAGCSGIHTGTAGVGKMAGTVEEDITAANLILRTKAEGPYFTQVWSKVAETDSDVQKLINEEEDFWKKSVLEKSKIRTDKVSNEDSREDWRLIQPTSPIISGGLNPVLFREFLNKINTVEYITTMGAGIHGHPDATKAGVKALLQAVEAWKQDVPLKEYAKDHHELAVAIEHYNKKGTQAKK